MRPQTKPAADLVTKSPFGQIHGIGNSENNQSTMAQAWPIKEIVHYALILRYKLVELIHQDHTGHPSWTRIVKLPLQQIQRMRRADSITTQRFPEQ